MVCASGGHISGGWNQAGSFSYDLISSELLLEHDFFKIDIIGWSPSGGGVTDCYNTRTIAVGAVAATTTETLPGVAAAVGLADIEKWHWNLCAMNQFHHQNNYLTMPHPNSSIKYNQLYCSSDKYIHPSFSEDVFMPACCSCQRKGGSPLLSDNAVRAADCCSHNSSPLLCPPQHGFISPHLKWELSLVIITLFCIPRQDSAEFVWSWSQLRCQQDFTEFHSPSRWMV